MAGRIELGEGETLAEALCRFGREVDVACYRSWSSTRPGCYEKPGVRRRRKAVTRRRTAVFAQLFGPRRVDGGVYLTLRQLLDRLDLFRTGRQIRRQYRVDRERERWRRGERE